MTPGPTGMILPDIGSGERMGRERTLPELSKMTYSQMRWLAARLGVSVASSEDMDDDTAGVYCETTQSILIDRNMTYRQKRCTLAHELVHWEHGDQACTPTLNTKAECRTRRETAMRLIRPTEYAAAEVLHDGHPAGIAEELEVTKQVLDDYRRILHDTITS